MAAEIKTLSPAHVWSYFYDLTQIPRPTFHTEAVQEYLLALAKRLNSRLSMMLRAIYSSASLLLLASKDAPW